MKTVTIKYFKGSWTAELCTDDAAIIDEIKVSRKKVKELKLSDNVILKVNQQTTESELENIANYSEGWEGYDVYLEDVSDEHIDQEEEEEAASEYDVGMAYAMSDCESFDEFIDRCNFPEEYE